MQTGTTFQLFVLIEERERMQCVEQQLYDLDHVVLVNGKIYRVLANFRDKEYFFGYNVYSPDAHGDRIYQGEKYRKNFIEDERLPDDVLETYEVLRRSDIVWHIDPVQAAQKICSSFANTIWFDLYQKLIALFGVNAVGIFGSSMFHFHLLPTGQVRKDVDFVIEGLEHVERFQRCLPEIRQQLGFQEISEARQVRQYQRYQRVFHNTRNTLQEIIQRRWTGLQLSEQIVSTLRFREKSIVLPLELVHQTTIVQKNVVISGKVIDAERSNLFPRMFTLSTEKHLYPVYIWWWKFSTPVRSHDRLTLCGDKIMLEGQEVIRVTNFHNHWLAFAT
jgi:predicted nucleotidyltransferase